MWAMRRPLLAAALVALLAAACGPGNPTPTPTATPTPTPTATATPTAEPPDTERIDLLGTGVGSYMLVAVPVAILHNAATAHVAMHVLVHFTVTGGSRGPFGIDAQVVSLAPGETLAVAADCTDTCNHANETQVSVTVGSWVSGGRRTLTVTGAAYSCGGGCGGHQNGDVLGTVSGAVSAGATVYSVAVCTNSGGTIIGGGSSQITWGGGATQPIDVSVILSANPARCTLYATVP